MSPPSLKLYFHPLASFCWKVLIAFYENDTPFEPHIVDLSDASSSAELKRLWPVGKFPVVRDDARDCTVPESTVIIEYLSQYYPGPVKLIPADPDRARETRLRDRFYDLYVHEPMQKIVGDRRRPKGMNDPHGVGEARAALETAYGIIEREMGAKTWAMGDVFTLADCAAAPAMYYANRVHPLGAPHEHAAAYLRRLMERPSVVRTLKEAKPYFAFFPE
jgi:glutathione S-transferase